jgi:xanthine phosphoribosyltransferase
LPDEGDDVQLAEWVRREGQVLSEEFLRVDGFLNHRIAPAFIAEAGRRIASLFDGTGISLVVTAEAAGNVIAYELARRLDARAVYAKKGKARTMAHPIARTLRSPTKGTETEIAISRDYLRAGERALIVDDFLYQGTTSAALADMVIESGAQLVGFAFIIEKAFAGGRAALSRYALPVESLLCVERMDPKTGSIAFSAARRDDSGAP